VTRYVRAVAGDLAAIGIGITVAYVISYAWLYRKAFPPPPNPKPTTPRSLP
jgi:hypothetical protein